MTAYLLGLVGWLVVLALQVFVARRRSAKRRAAAREMAERRPIACTVLL
jgi:hypothetical protein